MPEFIISLNNLGAITAKINDFVEDHQIDMICLKELKPIKGLDQLPAGSTYNELSIEHDSKKFLSRKARHKPFSTWRDHGLFAQIGDCISFNTTSISCIHNDNIVTMPRKMTILRIHIPTKKPLREIPGVVGKQPGGGPRPEY